VPDSLPRSWTDLHERLYAGAWQPALGRFRSTLAFRGTGDASIPLTTSLQHLASSHPNPEAHLLRNFRKYASTQPPHDQSTWNWLALAQHHGLPTRLLDWTYSPLVALHFATAELELYDRDAAIWCIDYIKTHALLPESLKQILHEEGSDVFTAEMLDRAARNLPELDELHQEPFVLFLEPPSLDQRIVNQFALFSLLSSPTVQMDQWLHGHPDLFQRILLPAKLKWEVRDKLDQANITERVLFPGLDGLCRWLTRYYTPTASSPPPSPAASSASSADAQKSASPSAESPANPPPTPASPKAADTSPDPPPASCDCPTPPSHGHDANT
jgi:hypothetical protein